MKRLLKSLTAFALIIVSALAVSCITVTPNSGDEDANVVNGITQQEIIKANVTVYAQYYNPVQFGEPKKTTSQGSGVIYYASQTETAGEITYTYRVLSNNHVVYKPTEYSKIDFFVRDCFGELIEATLLASNANYDLAVLSFTSENEYKVLEFEEENLPTGSKVVALGQPLGQYNAVTLGKIKEYEKVATNADAVQSNVLFSVIKHSAPIDSGSSGGALLTYSYKICGINFGATENSVTGEFSEGCAVPIVKVKEFLTANNLMPVIPDTTPNE